MSMWIDHFNLACTQPCLLLFQNCPFQVSKLFLFLHLALKVQLETVYFERVAHGTVAVEVMPSWGFLPNPGHSGTRAALASDSNRFTPPPSTNQSVDAGTTKNVPSAHFTHRKPWNNPHGACKIGPHCVVALHMYPREFVPQLHWLPKPHTQTIFSSESMPPPGNHLLWIIWIGTRLRDIRWPGTEVCPEWTGLTSVEMLPLLGVIVTLPVLRSLPCDREWREVS